MQYQKIITALCNYNSHALAIPNYVLTDLLIANSHVYLSTAGVYETIVYQDYKLF